jgi:hypothetical protein
MKRVLVVALLSVALSLAMAATARANQVFTPAGGGYEFTGWQAENDPFCVSSTPFFSTDGSNYSKISDDGLFEIYASTEYGYTDSGVAFDFSNGGLKLGTLTGVNVNFTALTSDDHLSVNLWFDTSGNGEFFSFIPFAGRTEYNGLGGDVYGLGPTQSGGSLSMTESSSFFLIGGAGNGDTYTLAQLQAGAVSGINADTPVAVWIGATPNSSDVPVHDTFGSVTILTTPEPLSMIFFGTGIVGVAGYVARRRMQRKA